ncbi:ATP-binding protein [bacterium]|nr:ATP-binding protein [bacterium]
MFIDRVAAGILEKLLASKKIILLLGARQVGKTTLVKELLKSTKTLLLNLDIEVDTLKLLAAAKLPPSDALNYLGNPDHLVIDEAHQLPEVTKIVKGWYDSNLPVKIILLGSSSFNLLNQSAETLVGRNEKLFLPPFLFEESVGNEDWFPQTMTATAVFNLFGDQIKESCFMSMVFGQYPESVTTKEREIFMLNLVSDYLFKDVFQLELVKRPDLIKKLLRLLAYQAGSEVSVNELSKSLGMARATVERYLDLLEATFVIFRLPSFGTNPRKEISKTHKIYFWDTGVRNALLKEFSLSKTRSDIGALFENWIVAEAVKKNMLHGNRKSIYFWRSKGNSEVDLVIKENDNISAYEIKWSKNRSNKKAFSERYGVPVTVININNFYPIIDLF